YLWFERELVSEGSMEIFRQEICNYGNEQYGRKSVPGDGQQWRDWQGHGQRTGQNGRDSGDGLSQPREGRSGAGGDQRGQRERAGGCDRRGPLRAFRSAAGGQRVQTALYTATRADQ